MRIACLAWGSLVWDIRDLAVSSPWYKDGPNIPVEFARQSSGNRLTLVLHKSFQILPSLWAWMVSSSLNEAIESLRNREGTSTKRIGVWQQGEDAPELIPELPTWATENNANSVIWTALPPKYRGEDYRVPSVDEALDYFRSLVNKDQLSAERYVRKAPAQIRTPYRKVFEERLRWFPE